MKNASESNEKRISVVEPHEHQTDSHHLHRHLNALQEENKNSETEEKSLKSEAEHHSDSTHATIGNKER